MKNVQWNVVFVFVVIICASGFAAAEEITIVGTGSGTGVLQAIADAFSRENPDVTIILPESIGSGGGIKAVGRDEYLLGRIARELQEKEQPYGLMYVPYAKIPIVFYVNKGVKVSNLTRQQVLDIYSGKMTNWKEVGGDDMNVRVVTREEGDSSLAILLESFPGFKDISITSRAKTTFSDPETEETVVTTPQTISYGPYSNARLLDVKILTIDGKGATEADYPYVGPAALIYKAANYTGNIKKFVEFVTSEAAHEVIKEAGGIPF